MTELPSKCWDHRRVRPAAPHGVGRLLCAGIDAKTLITEHGRVGIDAPRDRDGSFEPRIVRKRQRRARIEEQLLPDAVDSL